MKVQGEFIYLGLEDIKGRKDPTKVYYNLSLLQGSDVLKVFLDEETVKKVVDISPKLMSRVKCELEISISQKTYVNLSSIEKVA